jgi:pyruvate dehydrogenase E1 component alpha subunit
MAVTIDKKNTKLYISMLKKMLLIRRVEEKASQMYGLRKIGGFLHLYIGQEAIAAGAIAALDLKRDYVLTAYRDHGHALACGMPADKIMAELYGRETGCSRGKGGSMHLFDKENHFMGGNGIVGAHIPVATGVAYKIKYAKVDGVVLCFFGDGAIHQGSFHESLNLASIWNLPVVYICENNQYGMGTSFARVSSVTDFSIMAASYAMPGKQVDGMDVLEVYTEVKAMVQRARKESLPGFLEIRTYRYKGHSMSDPAKYRTKEELEAYKNKDPILILKNRLMQESLISEDDFIHFDQEAKKAAKDSSEFAESSPAPELKSLYDHVLL